MFDVGGLLRNVELPDGVLLGGLVLLEVTFHLEGAVTAAFHTEALLLILEAGRVRTSVVIDKSVRVRRFRTETRSDKKLCTKFRR